MTASTQLPMFGSDARLGLVVDHRTSAECDCGRVATAA